MTLEACDQRAGSSKGIPYLGKGLARALVHTIDVVDRSDAKISEANEKSAFQVQAFYRSGACKDSRIKRTSDQGIPPQVRAGCRTASLVRVWKLDRSNLQYSADAALI